MLEILLDKYKIRSASSNSRQKKQKRMSKRPSNCLRKVTAKRFLFIASMLMVGIYALFVIRLQTLANNSKSLTSEKTCVYCNQTKQNQTYVKKALMVEPFYKTNAIHFVLENALERLPSDWQVVAYMPLAAKDFFENLCKGTAKQKSSKRFQDACISGRFVHQIMPEQDFYGPTSIYVGHHWRNVMFNNQTWWKAFEAEWILVIQSDTIICRNGEPPLKHGYIGGASDPGQIFYDNKKSYFYGHMNGGFSLRNVEWTIKCLEKRPEINVEDSKFTDCFKDDLVNSRIPYNEVVAFASDNGWTTCEDGPWGSRVCPYGLHKPWGNYGSLYGSVKFEDYQEMLNSCPGVSTLEFFQFTDNLN